MQDNKSILTTRCKLNFPALKHTYNIDITEPYIKKHKKDVYRIIDAQSNKCGAEILFNPAAGIKHADHLTDCVLVKDENFVSREYSYCLKFQQLTSRIESTTEQEESSNDS